MAASTSTTGSRSVKAPLPASAEPPHAAALHAELRSLIASSRQRLAGAVNAELTRLYWAVGHRLHTEVLGGAARATYGDKLIDRLGEQLAQEFSRGFEAKNLRRMVQFAQVFAEPEIVATLSRQLSWSHFVNLLPLKTDPARQFYAHRAAQDGWSVRELRQQIERKAFERTELATLQAPATVQAGTLGADLSQTGATTGATQVFKDPYFLDFLGLRQGHDEADLEAAILRQLEAFILELGRGFAWGDMALLCADIKTRDLCARTLAQRKLPGKNRISPGHFDPTSNKIKVMTMKVSKGLEFPIVALPGVGHMPAAGKDEKEAAWVFYVEANRATQRLVIGGSSVGLFAQQWRI